MSVCVITQCVRVDHARGLCQAHYYRYLKYGDPLPEIPIRKGVMTNNEKVILKAIIDNLDNRTNDYPAMPAWSRTPTGEWGSWEVDKKGYVYRRRYGVNNKAAEYQLQHRLVMENYLGRPLTKGETVHHKNGIRSDNNLSNLELWATPQPYGQRVTDLIKFANDVLAKYGTDPDKFLLDADAEGC